jgi:hypothetical protein
MNRKYFNFSSNETLEHYIAEIKAVKDLAQLEYDLELSSIDHIQITCVRVGMYAMYATFATKYVHLFVNKQIIDTCDLEDLKLSMKTVTIVE